MSRPNEFEKGFGMSRNEEGLQADDIPCWSGSYIRLPRFTLGF